jgi:hypothetical protein
MTSQFGPTNAVYGVLLSHNRANKPRVRRLAERQPLQLETRNSELGIARLCLSPAALGSDWVGLAGPTGGPWRKEEAQHRAVSRPVQRRTPLHPAPAGRLQTPGHAAADHLSKEIAIGSKLGLHATKKRPDEGFNRPWPPPIEVDAAVNARIDALPCGTSR